MPLTDEEKRARKVQRVLDRFTGQGLQRCLKETAREFQKHVRLSSIGPDGKLTCCSCGRREYPSKAFHAGHWIGRSSGATLFDPRNCHPQCAECNIYGRADVKPKYDAFMRRKYGQDVMDELIRLSNTSKQWTREELAEMYVSYLEANH